MDVTPSTPPPPAPTRGPAPEPGSLVVAALDHPSLDGQVGPFLDALRHEQRRFGPAASRNPKPFPSLIAKVADRRARRLGAVVDGRIVGMAAIHGDGEIAVVVAPGWRGRGVGRTLLATCVERAIVDGFVRVHLLSSRRSKVVEQLGRSLGWTTVDVGAGRVELYIDLDRVRRIA